MVPVGVGLLLLLLIDILVVKSEPDMSPAPTLTPLGAGSLSVLDVPDPYVLPEKLILGPDHHLWFAAIAPRNFESDQPSGAIGRLALDGTFRMFPLPEAQSYPTHLTMGPDAALWFTAVQGESQVARSVDIAPHFTRETAVIGKMTLHGQFTLFPLSPPLASLAGIAAGQDGNVWFTDRMGTIGRITPAGVFTAFVIPGLQPHDALGPIIAGSDGNLWFGITSREAHSDNAFGEIGRIAPQGTMTIFPLGRFVLLRDMTIGPDHHIWFTSDVAVGCITPDGQVRTFLPPGHASWIARNAEIRLGGGIATGADGALWFATAERAVGRVTTQGVFTFYPFLDHSNFYKGSSSLTMGYLRGITSTPDGTFWLTDVQHISKFHAE
jgi:virginiamycin B lyase